jgi:hypothetical protein
MFLNKSDLYETRPTNSAVGSAGTLHFFAAVGDTLKNFRRCRLVRFKKIKIIFKTDQKPHLNREKFKFFLGLLN